MRCVATLLAVSLLAATPSVARQLDPSGIPDPASQPALEGDALTELFMGRTHRGYYQYHDLEERDPAFVEEMGADGSAVHNQDGVVSRGEWRTRHNVVCFEYETLNGGCFNVLSGGNCYFIFSAFSQELVAVTVLDGDTPDCEPSIA
ncbi:MAG: hypothetical protein AAF311_11605 [Pseudomonadota bacterium]